MESRGKFGKTEVFFHNNIVTAKQQVSLVIVVCRKLHLLIKLSKQMLINQLKIKRKFHFPIWKIGAILTIVCEKSH